MTNKIKVAKKKSIAEVPKSNISTFDSYILQKLDQIDTKFENKFDHLDNKIDRVEESLRDAIKNVENNLRSEIQSIGTKVDSNFKWLLSMMFVLVLMIVGLYLK